MHAVRPRAHSRALRLSSSTLLVTIATLTGLLTTGAPAVAATTTQRPSSGRSTLAVSPHQQTIDYGEHIVFRAHLANGSRPVADQPVELVWQSRGTEHRAKGAWTDRHGDVRFNLRLYHTRTWRVVARSQGNSGATRSDSRHVRVRTFGESVVHEASRYHGAPYRYGAAGPHSFDCSGFTMFIWRKFGHHLPHSAAGQYHVHGMRHLSRRAKRPGDFIFMHSGGSIYHVGIYAGHNRFWAATHSGSTVREEPLWSSSYYVGRLPA